MREIEVKFKVSDGLAVKRRLADLGCQLGEAVAQDDLVFEHPEQSSPRCVLRIRTTVAGSILTLKKDITNELDCLEIETGVTDPQATRQLLEEMGYQLVVEVKKRRQRGLWDGWEVCFDEVDELGTFIEIEALYPDDQTGDDRQAALAQAVTERLALSNLERVTSGYDTLRRRQMS